MNICRHVADLGLIIVSSHDAQGNGNRQKLGETVPAVSYLDVRKTSGKTSIYIILCFVTTSSLHLRIIVHHQKDELHFYAIGSKDA